MRKPKLRFARQSKSTILRPGPYVGLANLYMTRGDFKSAVDVLQQGLGVTSDDAWLSTILAEAYHRAGDPEKALGEYEKALKKDPRSDVAANNVAALLSERKGGKADLERALSLARRFESSSNPAFLDTLGWIYFLRGENDRALPVLHKVVELAPREPLFRYHLGMALYKQGDTQSAKIHLKAAVESKASFAGADEASRLLGTL